MSGTTFTAEEIKAAFDTIMLGESPHDNAWARNLVCPCGMDEDHDIPLENLDQIAAGEMLTMLSQAMFATFAIGDANPETVVTLVIMSAIMVGMELAKSRQGMSEQEIAKMFQDIDKL